MARTLLTPISIPTPLATVPVEMTFTVADFTNGNKFSATGREIVVVKNIHAATAKTFTVTSVAINGRLGSITAFSVAALKEYVLPFFSIEGWKQSDGFIYIDGEDANIKIQVMTLP